MATKKLTTRQFIINQVGHRLGTQNYNAHASQNDLPYTTDWQAKVNEYKERFGTDLIVEHVDQMYSTMYTNSVEGFLLGFVQERSNEFHDYQKYIDGLTDRAYKMLLNAIVKRAERITEILTDGMEATVRQAKKN